jgi:hypothetical protein
VQTCPPSAAKALRGGGAASAAAHCTAANTTERPSEATEVVDVLAVSLQLRYAETGRPVSPAQPDQPYSMAV